MDSGNSGSIQSSSGGEEEYDSRAESISVFLNNNNNNPLIHVGPMPNPPQQQPPPNHHHHHHHHHPSSSSIFDPLSSYFDPLSSSSSRSPPQFTNLDMVWSKSLRSDSTYTDHAGFIPPTQPFLSTQQPPTRPNFPSIQIPQPQETGSGTIDQTNPVRNPKKRSRASRRAPTTVLTTDTTNFRAMVQEFTGIPAPPFASSSFPRSGLDLFGTPTLRSNSPPPPLLRPFPQKVQPFLSSSSSVVDAIASTTTTTTNNTTSRSNYQLSSDLGILKQNPVLNLHSLLQPSPKFPILDTLKPQQNSLQIPVTDSQLKMGALEDFGLTHGIQNMVPSSSDSHQSLLRSINANYSNSRSVSNNGNFRGDKGPANVATRTEGIMESWICSSD